MFSQSCSTKFAAKYTNKNKNVHQSPLSCRTFAVFANSDEQNEYIEINNHITHNTYNLLFDIFHSNFLVRNPNLQQQLRLKSARIKNIKLMCVFFLSSNCHYVYVVLLCVDDTSIGGTGAANQRTRTHLHTGSFS